MRHQKSVTLLPLRLAALAISAMAIFACSSDDDTISSQTNAIQQISFNVAGVEDMHTTRSLIQDYNNLRNACTPVNASHPEYLGEMIGIWGDCTAGGVTQENIFPNASLYYQNKDGGNPNVDSDTNVGWNYPGNDLYWSAGGIYKFRAYYPQEQVKEGIIPSSNATTFVIDYNTIKLQRDLLVGYQSIDTRSWELSRPVPIRLRHALAAITFRFKFEDTLYETDYLTSCWLQNTPQRDFASVGMLAYGDETNPNWLRWQESYASPVTEKMYFWEHPRNDSHPDGGVMLKNNESSSETDIIAQAYTKGGTAGNEFTANNGYVLIIPQQSDGTTKLCFTTYEGGSTIYEIAIPAITGTSTDTQRDNNTYDENGTLVLGSAIDSNGTDFVAGYCYNYTITITKTNLKITLSIADWNKLDSSFDITF